MSVPAIKRRYAATEAFRRSKNFRHQNWLQAHTNFAIIYFFHSRQRRRSYDADEPDRTACQWCEYALVITLATILLIGVSALTIFWVFYYRDGYAWAEDLPDKQFNLHPTLMVAGFITFSGFCKYITIIFISFKLGSNTATTAFVAIFVILGKSQI